MDTVMNVSEFITKLKDVALNYKTLYVMGCFGAPMTAANKTRYCSNHEYNEQATRTKMIKAASADIFGFDCCGLIKGILWGWNGDKTKTYGGATYASNGVPDLGADGMIKTCADVSTDFSNIEVGELLWRKGHIGVYIGDGLGVEATPTWKNKVQITAVKNIGAKSGYNSRTWTKHGKFPHLKYDVPTKTGSVSNKKTSTEKTCQVPPNVLKKGMKGEHVKALQILLIAYGYSCGSSRVDGSFGSSTDKAVRAYQKANGLTVDGLVGPSTWAKLLGMK